MKSTDCLLLFLCVGAIWWSLPSSSKLAIVQKWKIPFATSHFRNSHYPEEREKLPPPIVTDLNGDGLQDIVYLTTDFEIKISDGVNIKELGDEIGDTGSIFFSNMNNIGVQNSAHLSLQIPELTNMYSATLLPDFGITYGRRPVAMSTGFIDKPGTSSRQQVIVVLTDSWVVMCFDHRLNKMWESTAVPEPNQSLYHKEASIMITQTPLTNGDRGIIVVGGRKGSMNQEISHEHMDKEEFVMNKVLPIENGDKIERIESTPLNKKLPPGIRRPLQVDEDVDHADNNNNNTNDDDNANPPTDAANSSEKKERANNNEAGEVLTEATDTAREYENHFSYYAYEGHTGALRWKHEPADYINSLDEAIARFQPINENAEVPDTGLQLHLLNNAKHLGEVHWRTYEHELRKQIPSVWRTREDTRMKIAHFERKRSIGKTVSHPDVDQESWMTGEFFEPVNVNLDFGSKSNRPVFQSFDDHINRPNVIVSRTKYNIEVLHLFSGRPLCSLFMYPENLYADINNDGVIDKIETIAERKSRKTMGQRNAKKENTCVAVVSSGVPTTVEKLFETSLCNTNKVRLGVRNEPREVVDIAHPTTVVNRRGLHDLLFLVSDGRITSVGPTGKINWQTDTSVKWSQVDKVKKRSSRFANVESFLEMGGFPSLQTFALTPYGYPHHVLAVGYHTLALVHIESGSVEVESRLPSIVNGPPVYGDWDSDGDSDIIVPCINGFVGLRVTNGSGTPLYSVLFGAILIAIPVLFFIHQSNKKPAKKQNDQFLM